MAPDETNGDGADQLDRRRRRVLFDLLQLGNVHGKIERLYGLVARDIERARIVGDAELLAHLDQVKALQDRARDFYEEKIRPALTGERKGNKP